MLKETAEFIDDEALSRGAAIAFYIVTSIAPARHNQVRPRSARLSFDPREARLTQLFS